MSKYIWAIDPSLSSSGIAIFGDDAKPIMVTSIDTRSVKTRPEKLKVIADTILDVRKRFSPNLFLYERGFYRFNDSTKALYMVHGIIQYLLWDIEQIGYAPSTIKKVVGGKGNMKKDELREIIEKKFPEIKFSTDDETDAIAIGLCYFIETEAKKRK